MVRRPIDPAATVEEADVRAVKAALAATGHYAVPDHGLTGWTDRGLFDGIRAFQRAAGLPVTGILRPGDGTATRLAEAGAAGRVHVRAYDRTVDGQVVHVAGHERRVPEGGARGAPVDATNAYVKPGTHADWDRAKGEDGFINLPTTEARFRRECVTLVTTLHRDIGTTATWREGTKITVDNIESIPPGTAIATFNNGIYPPRGDSTPKHAALFVRAAEEGGVKGAYIYDQYARDFPSGRPKPAGVRFVAFDGAKSVQNDIGRYSVIRRSGDRR
jgi:peptidoglycan hydrolase-like protein with peptidoglycan-binding domain